MDPDLNQLNQLLEDENSFNMPSVMHNMSGGRFGYDFRNQESLFSPANNQFRNRIFAFQTPSPFKANQYYYEDENECSQDLANYRQFQHPKQKICEVLHFDQSPKFKPLSTQPATISRTPRFIEYSLTAQNKRNNRKNSKGLRNLSESVYKIVLDHKMTTYKQVAEELVKMLNDGEFGDLREANDERNKDEQNIKRRVYDALNVLISADVLKKNGKYVISDDHMLSDKIRYPGRLIGSKETPSDLLDQIEKKKSEIKEKRGIVDSLKMKKQLLQSVIKRNRKKKHSQQNKILFPLLGVSHKLDNHNLKITLSKPLKVSISNLRITQLIGDLDLLMKIGIDLLGQSIEEIMEQENDDQEQQSCNVFKIKDEERPIENRVQKIKNKQKQQKKERRLLYTL